MSTNEGIPLMPITYTVNCKNLGARKLSKVTTPPSKEPIDESKKSVFVFTNFHQPSSNITSGVSSSTS